MLKIRIVISGEDIGIEPLTFQGKGRG